MDIGRPVVCMLQLCIRKTKKGFCKVLLHRTASNTVVHVTLICCCMYGLL